MTPALKLAMSKVDKDSALLWQHDIETEYGVTSLFMFKYADKITIVEVDLSAGFGRHCEVVFDGDVLEMPDLFEQKEEGRHQTHRFRYPHVCESS